MKGFFITAKKETPLLELLAQNIPEKFNPETVITSGGVWLWHKKIRLLNPEYPVPPKETVKVHISSFQGKIHTLEPKQVVYENKDFLAVYKPHNLNVHAVPSSLYYHLAHGVDHYLKQQGIRFESSPITRLDRAVAGLVLFAKNKPAERKLFELVKNRKVQKWYTAALEKNLTHENPHRIRVKDKISNNGRVTQPDPKGKNADTLFIKTHSLPRADIYSVFIFTGRRHQIRFHASTYLSPVLGDHQYGSSVDRPPDEISLICRGYNLNYRRERIRIRIPQHYLDAFLRKAGAGQK